MKILKNFDLTTYNSYRIKASCKVAYFPESVDDVIKFHEMQLPYVLLGSGHNVIFSKTSYNENFIIFNGNFNKVNTNENIIEAEAGATILQVSKNALNHSLTGAEFLYDIPSSVGGAVVMNAGTKEGETKNILKNVLYLDLNDMMVKEKNKEEINFEYRNSFFQKNKDKVILKAWFELKHGNASLIKKTMEDSKERRWAMQPKEFPNAGSVFKRPKGFYVGAMIDELNLKGFTIGGAKISEKHGGFIINHNNATGQDIIDIIKEVKKGVMDRFNVDLQIEQRII
jgi:UDP-N-acetylmuramate dehydrogenase